MSTTYSKNSLIVKTLQYQEQVTHKNIKQNAVLDRDLLYSL